MSASFITVTPLSLYCLHHRHAFTTSFTAGTKTVIQGRHKHCENNRKISTILSKININPVPTIAFTAYITKLFIFPTIQPHPFTRDLPEAINLSLNFGYILPVIFPQYAPTLQPTLESIFHVVVSWALLTFSFSSIDLFHSNKLKATPFLVASLFLTNLFYLPYLILRDQSIQFKPQALPKSRQSALLKFTESKLLPASCLVTSLISVLWFLYGRPEYGGVGDFTQRFVQFVDLVRGRDLLAFSFALDCLVYVFFQAALVDTDACCRVWSSEQIKRNAKLTAKLVPFFGLVFYLWQRAEHAPLQWIDGQDR